MQGIAERWGEDVVATLGRVCSEIGYPKTIRVDQGSEFISRDVDLWAYTNGVTLNFSRSHCPASNRKANAERGQADRQCVHRVI